MNSMAYPVLDILDELKSKLASDQVVILQAPPGAGKSTILPLQLIGEPWLGGKKIVMLEPRRLAARSVATRMADLLGESVGKRVGYRVRFENRVSTETKIEVVTEGILTRMIQNDNSLENIGLVIFDEFHERSLQADLALALTLQVRSILRDDLRIIVMSATLDIGTITTSLKAPLISSQGRQHPIAIEYHQEEDNRIHINVIRGIKRALLKEKGDILVFLPGAGEIQRVAEALTNELPELSVHPLYGDLPFDQQQKAILPDAAGRRKVVLATSIAETSLTIEGIGVVVDSGYARVPKFDPKSGFTKLETVRVTKDVAEQRAGRAGRLGPGVCYRLWAANVQATLKPSRIPEILEADLAPVVLELSEWGVNDVNSLDWITPPPVTAVHQARQILTTLGAIHNGQITPRGKKMVKLPTHPRIAHLLVEAERSQNGELISIACDLAALLEERDPLGKEAGADVSLRIDALRKWRSRERVNGDRAVFERIERLASIWRKQFGISIDNNSFHDALVGRLIMEAFPERIAKQTEAHGERYKLMNNRMAKLPPHDALTREPWIAVAELDAGTGEGKIFLAAPLDEKDLAPHATEIDRVYWDDARGMIVAVRELKIGIHALESRPLSTVTNEQRVALWCEVLREKGLKLLGWEEQLTSWQSRVMSLRKWRPEESWPDVSHDALLATLETWLAPFLNDTRKLSELARLDAHNILASILPWELQTRFDKLAPTSLDVPSGSSIKLNYSADGAPPVMEVRLQEVFGLLETPTVNDGRNKVILHLLSPGYKPVQVTQDLRSFWTTTYHEVRKELRMRYPKHSWPEDPWTAEAVRGARRRS